MLGSLTPGQAFIGIVHRELIELMGGQASPLNLRAAPPVVVLLAGLQGAGKTTTRRSLPATSSRRSARRCSWSAPTCAGPAAMLQLERLAAQVGAQYFPADAADAPAKIARAALAAARTAASSTC